MRVVQTGENLAPGSPVLALRQRLEREVAAVATQHVRMNQEKITLLMIKAWNAWRDGETRGKLQVQNPITDANFDRPH